ncbi:VWA domain-containing protein [Pseudomonas sp. GD03860]|uniref:VWA domain-containing protein n=1 Tax=Pseudomonas TaxID=286 RepID=UPI002363EC0E|nr:MULTISPECIES: VWA domain-containing protein [Pseudomonas]MDD2059797.1 VWA domain-containing protein [Pseudomonas putida]MDH0637249.1 VWA domain-containing protein [Pseudomonas sp. GD03860]
MQRVLRDTQANQDAAEALEQTVGLIRQHFPPSIAHLYATPRQGSNGVLEWWTALEGQPHLYASLERQQQAVLLQRYEERQAAVQQLARELERRGQGAAAQALARLIGAPDLNNLYSINGEPLVVRWGQPQPAQAPIAPKAPAPPMAAPRPAPAPPPPLPVPPRRPLVLWPWLLGLLLLALLYGLYLGWPWLRQLWITFTPQAQICTPGGNSQASEFAVVLDTSGSMDERIRIKRENEAWYITLLRQVPLVEEFLPYDTNQRVSRMDVAKSSLTTVIQNLHQGIDMRLVTFDGCRTPVDHGVFDPSQRGELTQRISQLQPQGGTALGISLEAAAARMNGRNRDGVIIMFVDGSDSCGQSVCAVSRQIAEQQPRLRINIVNISASSGSNCAAKNTGGRVYTANDAAAVAAALQEASQEVSSASGCN